MTDTTTMCKSCMGTGDKRSFSKKARVVSGGKCYVCRGTGRVRAPNKITKEKKNG